MNNCPVARQFMGKREEKQSGFEIAASFSLNKLAGPVHESGKKQLESDSKITEEDLRKGIRSAILDATDATWDHNGKLKGDEVDIEDAVNNVIEFLRKV